MNGACPRSAPLQRLDPVRRAERPAVAAGAAQLALGLLGQIAGAFFVSDTLVYGLLTRQHNRSERVERK